MLADGAPAQAAADRAPPKQAVGSVVDAAPPLGEPAGLLAKAAALSQGSPGWSRPLPQTIAMFWQVVGSHVWFMNAAALSQVSPGSTTPLPQAPQDTLIVRVTGQLTGM